MHGDGKPHSINVCHVPRTGGLAQAEARVLVVVVDERLIAACVMRHSGRDVGFRTRRCGRLVDATIVALYFMPFEFSDTSSWWISF